MTDRAATSHRIRWRALLRTSHQANLRRYGRSLASGRARVVDPWLVAACAARVDAMLDVAEARIASLGAAPRWHATRAGLLEFRSLLEGVDPPLGTQGAHHGDLAPLRVLARRQIAELQTQCNHRAPALVSPQLLDRLVEALASIDDRLADVGELRGLRDEAHALRVEVRTALSSARARRRGLALIRERMPRATLLDLFGAELRSAARIVDEAEAAGRPSHPERPGLRRIGDRLAESDWQLFQWTVQLHDAEMATTLLELQQVEQRVWRLWDEWRPT